MPNLSGRELWLLQHAAQIHILTGQGEYEAPDASRRFAEILTRKGIPHCLDVWGHDVRHDWPWWLKMLPYSIDKMGW